MHEQAAELTGSPRFPAPCSVVQMTPPMLQSPLPQNFTGDMLKPSVVNTPVVRAVAVLASVALVAGSTAFLPARLGAFLHVTSYGACRT